MYNKPLLSFGLHKQISICECVMCIGGPRIGKRTSIYELPEIEKVNLAKKLPQLRENRIMKVAKNILFAFLDNHADNIIANAKIYTMDQSNPIVEAVAIKGSQILFAGKMADALIYKGANTKITDLRGRVMLPGFVDPHVHMCFTMFRHWIDLSPFINKSVNEIKQKVKAQVKQAKENEWVLSQLYDPTITDGEWDIGIKSLDEISETVPIFILQSNAHVAHVNSAVFKIAGVTKDTQDPPYGRFMKDENGQLTGELQQSAVHYFKKYLFGTGVKYEQNFKQFLYDCASKGCTTLNDCGIGIIDPKSDLAVLYEVMNDDPPVRYSGFLVSTSWDQFMEDNLMPEYKDPYLRIHGVKCWVDGSAQGGSAFMREKYIKEQWGVGKANYELEELTKAVKVAHDNGWQVAIHANGDAGIDIALDAYESVQKENPKPDMRHRIQHCTVCHKDQLQRMSKLKVTPSFLIGHVFYYGQVFRDLVLGQQRVKLLDPMQTAINCGVRPTMHSDYNCQPVDPIRCMHNAVTRKMRRCGGILNKEECITPYQAMKAITIDAAWQCHMNDIVGSIQKGKKADFVVLNEDPLKIPEEQLINLKVVETWMDGRRTYKSEQLRTLQSLNSTGQIKSLSSLRSQQSV